MVARCIMHLEESPDFMEVRCLENPGRGDPRESATENKLLRNQ